MTITEDLIEEPTTPSEVPTTPKRRKPWKVLGVAAGVAALVAVPALAVASDDGPHESDVLACEATFQSYTSLQSAVDTDLTALEADVAAQDASQFSVYADKWFAHAEAAKNLDTSGCELVAPSFAPAVAAAAEGWHYFALTLDAAGAGSTEESTNYSIQAQDSLQHALDLGGDALDEYDQTVEDLGM
jgi:hypothetical protein